MKKRLVELLLVAMMFVTGCGNGSMESVQSSNDVKEEKIISYYTDEDMGGNEDETEEKAEEKAEMAEADGGNAVRANNLTETNEKEIVIDYSIDSYEMLQDFSLELFEYNYEKENPVISPVSAYLALAMAGAGAEGETRKAFQEVLKDLEGIPNDLMLGLPRNEEWMKIALANSAWVDNRLTPNKEWLAWVDSVYKSEVFQTELAAMNTYIDMNCWISEKTEGLIKELYDEPLDADTRLVLLNTLYFKGEWMSKFEEGETREEEFTLEDGKVELVKMMNKSQENLLYVKDDMAEGVVLPYRDDSIAFVALKPVGGMSVREMCANLTTEDLSRIIGQEEMTLCNLKLPKFEVEFETSLNDSLIDMGLGIAFENGVADFSGIGTLDDAPNMYIDMVRQKVVVIVDEEGTEAAAVTSIVMNRCTGLFNPEMPINVYFDEPFLYMLVDRDREVPMFIGIMENPNK